MTFLYYFGRIIRILQFISQRDMVSSFTFMGQNSSCCNKNEGESKVYIDEHTDSNGDKLDNDFSTDFSIERLKFSDAVLAIIQNTNTSSEVRFDNLSTIDGGHYSGFIKNGRRCGFGIQSWSDGAVYTGEWENDLPHGKGQMKYNVDGKTYIGSFKRGRCDGFGVGTSNKNTYTTTYVGEYANDLSNGVGEEYWSDGSKYTGQFKDGMKNGYGVYFWNDGGVYRGMWENNEIQGHGHYQNAKGRVFVGQWAHSIKHGYGSHFWDGQLYDGTYVNDIKSGFGVFTWTDKKMYVGYWANGQQNGPGIVSDANDRFKLTLWENGHRISSANYPKAFKSYEDEYKVYEDKVKEEIRKIRSINNQ